MCQWSERLLILVVIMCVNMSVCVSVCPCVCLCVSKSVCVHVSVCVSVCPSVCLFVSMSACLSVCQWAERLLDRYTVVQSRELETRRQFDKCIGESPFSSAPFTATANIDTTVLLLSGSSLVLFLLSSPIWQESRWDKN